MPVLNGQTTYDHHNPIHHETIEEDACLKGVGGIWGNFVYTARFPARFINDNEFSITHYELINLLVAIRVWGQS